jgi:uncharacterized protein (TIGR00645 family)
MSEGVGKPVLRVSTGNVVERTVERLLFLSRWLMAPFYLGLGLALVLLLIEYVREFIHLVNPLGGEGHDGIIIGVLSLIDLSLIGNLMLMVMLTGYESFVSKLNIADEHERLDWMGRIGFGDLKLKLTMSIVAISGIRLLEIFMDVRRFSDRELAWTAGVHATFVLAALTLAIVERLLRK